jgi:hypothetical protein
METPFTAFRARKLFTNPVAHKQAPSALVTE